MSASNSPSVTSKKTVQSHVAGFYSGEEKQTYETIFDKALNGSDRHKQIAARQLRDLRSGLDLQDRGARKIYRAFTVDLANIAAKGNKYARDLTPPRNAEAYR
jgi:hypothetical protein